MEKVICNSEMQNSEHSPALELTKILVKIDSSDPGAYEGEIGNFLYHLLKNRGVETVKEEVLPGRWNVMGKIPGEISDPALVFICHMDTVTLGESWTISPLSGEISDGKLYGRGSCDMKSGLACGLSAFLSIYEDLQKREKRPKHTFLFIATVDEEDFMRGVEKAIESGWVTKNSYVLDMEPTDGKIRVAHKGRTWFNLSVSGITAHASTPHKGADAIAAMARMIVSIKDQIEETPVHPELGPSTVTFGQIQGGYRPYVVPDCCDATIDMRLAPPVTTRDAVNMVETAIASVCAQMPGITASFQITGDRPFIEKDDSSPLLSALKAAVNQVTGHYEVDIFPGYTDTAVIAGTLSNHNCMSYGPGNLEMAHKPDEFVPVEDIIRCEQVLRKLAEDMLLK